MNFKIHDKWLPFICNVLPLGSWLIVRLFCEIKLPNGSGGSSGACQGISFLLPSLLAPDCSQQQQQPDKGDMTLISTISLTQETHHTRKINPNIDKIFIRLRRRYLFHISLL